MCVACRESKPKQELVRVVRLGDGSFAADERGKTAGRGAYICKAGGCFAKAKKSRALERALGCDSGVYEQIAGIFDE